MTVSGFLRGFLTALAILWPLSTATAFEVSPMRMVLEAPGVGAAGRVTVRNTERTAVPIEIRFERRFVDENGQNRYEPADDDFVFFPPQTIIPVGSAQTFQFQYLGEPFTDKSRAYVMRVAEVPLELKSGVGLQVVYEFGVAVYIAPPDTTPGLSVLSVSQRAGGYELIVENSGTRHAVLGPQGLADIPGVSAQLTAVTPSSLRTVENPIIPPLSTRRFIVTPATPGQ